MFRRDIREIIAREDVDVLVTAYSAYMTGFPPFDVEIPIVFDYLDCAEWTSPRPHVKPYIEEADLVFAVSALAEEQAQQFNDRVLYLPNGADVEEIRQASGKDVRKRYGLEDATIVSLIGLMDRPSPYLLEAVLRAKEEIPKLHCLLVGESKEYRAALGRQAQDGRDAFTYVGPVPYEDIASYFAASDVGVYPVPGISYDDGRSPIKVFEYTAAGCPVVSPAIREVERLDFSNIFYASPNPSDFARGIVEACREGTIDEPAIDEYDWSHLADRFETVLHDDLAITSD
jgi:glycosyltransferase involved in cell wall biosynthesis